MTESSDAQKLMADVLGLHRYNISDLFVHRCICGEDIGRADDALDAHRASEVYEALAAGYAVVKLPQPDDTGGWFLEDIAAISTGIGHEVVIEGVGDYLGCTPNEARNFAGCLLAAAALCDGAR